MGPASGRRSPGDAGLFAAVIGDDIDEGGHACAAALFLDPADPLPDMVEPLAGARPRQAVVELAQRALEARGNALFLLRPHLEIAVEPPPSGLATLCTWTVWRERVSKVIAKSGSKRRARSRLTTG